MWVMQQYRQGITHPNYSFEQIKTFVKDGNLQKFLNPLDIKKIRNQQGVQAYLSKYMTKLAKNNAAPLNCRLWHCSTKLSKMSTGQAIQLQLFEETCMPEINFSVNRRTDKVYTVQTFVHEYCLINTIYAADYFNSKLTDLHTLNQWIINGMQEQNMPPSARRFMSSLQN